MMSVPDGMVYYPYTDREIPEQKSNSEHLISLVRGSGNPAIRVEFMEKATSYVAPKDMHGGRRRRAKAASARSQGVVPLTQLRGRSGVRADRGAGCWKNNSHLRDRGGKSQGGTYVTVRNFLTFSDKPEWHDTTLFLDGLDEARAGTEDGRTPLDDIRK